MNQNNTSTNMILHLGRLSDTIFALAMALTIFGFDFPKFAESASNIATFIVKKDYLKFRAGIL
ncbi:MAG: hypothetical protein WBA07_12120 [Rivularia sp. (in: cyanobacteria)]